jgi:endonuclease YncB( thermonuclease family)
MGGCCSINLERTIELQKYELENNYIKWEDAKPFIPSIKNGEVIKVYDGDTITIATKLPLINDDDIYRFSIRLNGINCPEMKSKNREEKNAAIFIQQTLENLLLHKNVTLKNISTEKYNRLLADVILYENNVEINISQWLLNNNYAVKYYGGTKLVPVHWKRYMRTGKCKLKKI